MDLFTTYTSMVEKLMHHRQVMDKIVDNGFLEEQEVM